MRQRMGGSAIVFISEMEKLRLGNTKELRYLSGASLTVHPSSTFPTPPLTRTLGFQKPFGCPTWPTSPYQCRQGEMSLLDWAYPGPITSPRFEGQDNVLAISAQAEGGPVRERGREEERVKQSERVICLCKSFICNRWKMTQIIFSFSRRNSLFPHPLNLGQPYDFSDQKYLAEERLYQLWAYLKKLEASTLFLMESWGCHVIKPELTCWRSHMEENQVTQPTARQVS